MARKTVKPFDKIMEARTTLRLYLEHGDTALSGQSLADFMADLNECFDHLMTFRNIINGMVGFEEAPDRAVLPYLSNEVIADLQNDSR